MLKFQVHENKLLQEALRSARDKNGSQVTALLNSANAATLIVPTLTTTDIKEAATEAGKLFGALR
ncbi:hypothetical protein [Pseudoalteromonas sp.]|uniref:hypothetical protein n=1 Tax=Pseudoalteromonas sp. TaxID=53249 RepID=UPI0026240D01|nr:hypothetical protein [Pseudoalteromonas sp.]MCP4585676.1 hypothetical protein [Pseudoalteromonas sp.]